MRIWVQGEHADYHNSQTTLVMFTDSTTVMHYSCNAYHCAALKHTAANTALKQTCSETPVTTPYWVAPISIVSTK